MDDGRKGVFTLTWASEGEDGIACNLDSPGHQALYKATEDVLGTAEPFSIGGSLPLVREMQESGYDLQICGYGKSSKYHAQNESCSLTDMKNASQILAHVIYEVCIYLSICMYICMFYMYVLYVYVCFFIVVINTSHIYIERESINRKETEKKQKRNRKERKRTPYLSLSISLFLSFFL